MRVAALMLFLTVVVSTAFADAESQPQCAEYYTSRCLQHSLLNSPVSRLCWMPKLPVPSATLNGVDLEQVLDLITKPSNLVWQKLYAKPG